MSAKTGREWPTPRMRLETAVMALLDAMAEGSAIYWERRARQLEAARPRRGEFTGRATPAELSAQWQRLTEAAAACRARAALAGTNTEEGLATLTDWLSGDAA